VCFTTVNSDKIWPGLDLKVSGDVPQDQDEVASLL
jgi:hypothetical protein